MAGDAQAAGEARTASKRVDLVRGAMGRIAVMREALRAGNADAARQTASAYVDQMRLALDLGEVVRLDVEGEHLRCDAGDVLGNDLVSLAMLEGYEQQGLRRVSIEPSVNGRELHALAMLLADDWREKSSADQDMEAAAWQVGFRHVHFEMVGRRLTNESDVDELSPAELGARLVMQLGVEGLSEEGLQTEVGDLLDQLRRAPTGALAQGPAHNQLMAAPEHKVLARLLQTVTQRSDVTDDQVSRCLMETLRNARSEDEAQRLILGVVGHVRSELELGRPRVAVALARRLLVLGDEDLLPSFAYKTVVREGLRALWDEAGRAAMINGMRINPSVDHWQGALFTLCELAGAGEVASLCALGAAVDQAELRQPIADGLLMLCERTETSLKDLLRKSDEQALAVLLLAIRRRPDPTLVEPLLARVGSKDSRVREAVLLALRDHQSARIKEVMRAGLEDEAQAVRLEALRYLAVYRDAPAAEQVLARLQGALGKLDLHEDELRALALAFVHIRRAEAVAPLEALALAAAERVDKDRKPDEAPRLRALLSGAFKGLMAAGPPGREALERLGRTHPAQRAEIRAMMGGTR